MLEQSARRNVLAHWQPGPNHFGLRPKSRHRLCRQRSTQICRRRRRRARGREPPHPRIRRSGRRAWRWQGREIRGAQAERHGENQRKQAKAESQKQLGEPKETAENLKPETSANAASRKPLSLATNKTQQKLRDNALSAKKSLSLNLQVSPDISSVSLRLAPKSRRSQPSNKSRHKLRVTAFGPKSRHPSTFK